MLTLPLQSTNTNDLFAAQGKLIINISTNSNGSVQQRISSTPSGSGIITRPISTTGAEVDPSALSLLSVAINDQPTMSSQATRTDDDLPPG